MADALGLNEIREQLRKLNTDVYFGEGRDNPSIVTRLSLVEDCVTKMGNNLKWTVRLVAATFIAVIANLLVKVSH